MKASKDFWFGLEAEYLLADAKTFEPLWYRDLSFNRLHKMLEGLSVEGIPSLDGLELEPPHRKLMPYVVEGYHVPDADFQMVDIWPKGIELRTPIADSIDECLDVFKILYSRMQGGLESLGYRAIALSHHPKEFHFEGPQNKRRYDFWQWAMEVMTTYGPDVNVSLPADLSCRIDTKDLDAKINYYSPAMAALSVGSPLYDGGLWEIRGNIGKSFRTYRRSVIAPPIEFHPEENGRFEFKVFEMSSDLEDYRNYFLLFLALLLDDGLKGRSSKQSRVYDSGQVARFGLEAEGVKERAGEVLERAPRVLRAWGFDASSLKTFEQRWQKNRTPADSIVETFMREGKSIAAVLKTLSRLNCGEMSI